MIKYIIFDWGNTLGIKGARKNELWRQRPCKRLLRQLYLNPGVEELLEHLKRKGYGMGIITNSLLTTAENIHFLQALGLDHYFTIVLSSGDPSICKKACPEIFNLVMQNLNVKPHECVYIGDNYKKDIIGSKRVGMHAVYVTNNRVNPYIFVSKKNRALEDLQINNVKDLINYF